jgi:glutamine cyclotransferase
MPKLRVLLFAFAWLPFSALAVQQYSVKVIEKKPQARENFVQGLEIVDGELYVSAGNYGESRLLRYKFADGQLEQTKRLNPKLFAEGLTVLGDKVYQLTWRNQMMLIYQKADLQYLRWLPLTTEGWGLTNNGSQLVYSDGSDKLRFMVPDTGQVSRTVAVTEQGQPVMMLNELEWVDGTVWANIWQSERIVIIDPATGEVTASINLHGLLPAMEYQPGTDVLNGIARNPADGAMWVTGKRWPWMYHIELVPVDNAAETQHGSSNSR